MFDVDCNCGNDDCHGTLMVRKAPMYDVDGNKIGPFLHIDAMDGKSQSVELFLTPKVARSLTWELIKLFVLRRRQ